MVVIYKYIAKIMVTVLQLASPTLVKELREWAMKLRIKCAATVNPWDDVMAEVVCAILGV